MSIKVKVKLDGKDGQEMAKKMSLESAFHEMKTNPPAVLAQTKRKKGAAQANKQRVAIAMSKSGRSRPDASGSNFVSPNGSYRPDGLKPSWKRGKEHIPYAPVGAEQEGETVLRHKSPSQEEYCAQAFPNARADAPMQGPSDADVSYIAKAHDCVPGSSEYRRRKNNESRDRRSNLGKSRPMSPATDE